MLREFTERFADGLQMRGKMRIRKKLKQVFFVQLLSFLCRLYGLLDSYDRAVGRIVLGCADCWFSNP